MDQTLWLFSYGTLLQPEVQQELFGRRVPSVRELLPGFRVERLSITDPVIVALSGSDVHPVLRRGSRTDEVAGSALQLSPKELEQADRYEVSDYVRIGVTLKSGRRAFVYVHREDA